MPRKKCIATLRDFLLLIDDCSHKITYRVLESGAGLEIVYRHTRCYCPPWSKPEERVPETDLRTVSCSEGFKALLEEVRCTPVPPVPVCKGEWERPVSLRFGTFPARASYEWDLGHPPEGWDVLDRFARSIIREVHGDDAKA